MLKAVFIGAALKYQQLQREDTCIDKVVQSARFNKTEAAA